MTPYEGALNTAVPAVRKAGADLVIVVADECPACSSPSWPSTEWKLAPLAGGHCHTLVE